MSKRAGAGAHWDRTVIMALDRDATSAVELCLQPATSCATPTEWLLIHHIPGTASLSSVLQGLFHVQPTVVSNVPAPTPVGLSQEMDAEATEWSASACASTPSTLSRAIDDAEEWIELARVGYLTSEVHAYCILIKCRTASQAAHVKNALDRMDAPGTTAPVAFVQPTARTIYRSPDASVGARPLTTHPVGEERLDVDLLEVVAWFVSETPCGPAAGSATLRPPQGTRASAEDILSAKAEVALVVPSAEECGAARAEEPVVPVPAVAVWRSPPFRTASPATYPNRSREEVCAICQVESLSARAVVVTLCHHVFHLDCYSKLAVTSGDCPLCRFSMYDLLNDARCAVCGTFEDLWVCLICGLVGCGQGRRNDQQRHYDESGHSCAIQIATNRVWNYRSRMFLHQEVALLLDKSEDTEHSAEASSGDQSSATPAFWSRQWMFNEDEALKTAITESKQEMVDQYYMTILDELIEEQQGWLDRQQLGAHRLSERGVAPPQARPPPPALGSHLVNRCLQLAKEELHERTSIVRDYVTEMRMHVTKAGLAMRCITKRLRTSKRLVEETVLLQSFEVRNLKGQLATLQQRLQEAKKKGSRMQAEKEAEIKALEERVNALLF